MADNKVVSAAVGVGPTIATDEIGGVDHPRVKIEWGVDGSAVDASASNPLPVVQTGTPALPTGASTAAKQPALGTAGTASADVITVQGIASATPILCDGTTLAVSANFTRPADTTAYAALDTVSDSTTSPTMLSWANVGGSGYITKAHLGTSQSTNTARFRLHLYMATMTNTNDNAAFTILSGDFDNKVGYIDFLACATEGTGSTIAESLNKDIRLAYNFSSGSTLYGRLETLDAFTPASAQTFIIKLMFEKNR